MESIYLNITNSLPIWVQIFTLPFILVFLFIIPVFGYFATFNGFRKWMVIIACTLVDISLLSAIIMAFIEANKINSIWEEDIKKGIKKELTTRGHKAEALDIMEKGNFFDKKKIIIINIEDKIYTASITTSEKGTLISFI